MSRRKTVLVAAILLLFLWLTELHSILYRINPKGMTTVLDDFIQPGYTRKDISVQWHVKIYFDSFLIIAVTTVASFYIALINYRLGIVFKILSIYFCVDLFLFQWNYKTSAATYYSLIIFTTIIIVFMFVPLKRENEKGKIINFFRQKG